MYEEVRMWIGIKSVVEAYLADYHGSLEEDLKILEEDKLNPSLTHNERNILIFLTQEKKILVNLRKLAISMINLSKMNHK